MARRTKRQEAAPADGLGIAREALKRAGLDIKKNHLELAVAVLSEVFSEPENKRGRGLQTVDEFPDEFFLEVPVMIPAGLDRSGRINLYIDALYEPEALYNEVQESLNQWEEGNVDVYLYEDEEGEGQLVESTGQVGGIRIVEEED